METENLQKWLQVRIDTYHAHCSQTHSNYQTAEKSGTQLETCLSVKSNLMINWFLVLCSWYLKLWLWLYSYQLYSEYLMDLHYIFLVIDVSHYFFRHKIFVTTVTLNIVQFWTQSVIYFCSKLLIWSGWPWSLPMTLTFRLFGNIPNC